MYEKEWLPTAISLGVSYDDFWNMNPRIIGVIVEGYKSKINKQLEYDNYVAYLGGIYVRDALLSTVGNMFSKKTSKPIEYPREPYPVTEKQKEYNDEQEKERQRQLFLAKLQAMQTNFELNNSGR